MAGLLGLTLTENGTIHVTRSRVTLESVVHQYQQGNSAEAALRCKFLWGVFAPFFIGRIHGFSNSICESNESWMLAMINAFQVASACASDV